MGEKRGILHPGSYDLERKPQVYMSNEYAKALDAKNKFKDDHETSPEAMTEESNSSSDDSEDVYPTFLDRMREERERKIAKLEISHRRRPTREDLEEKGIVERGYFDNMQVALNEKKKRRLSFTTELASFFQQRPDIAQMLTKGLVAAEFIGMDSVEMQQKRKAIKSKLNRKLNKKRRPTMDELEMRGIVPFGYFSDAENAVTKKHTRRMTAEKELGGFLPKRMDPRKMMERGLIPQHHFKILWE